MARQPYLPHFSHLDFAVGSGVLFIILTKQLSGYGIPLTLTLHKYPPDAYYLSYSLFLGSLVAAALSQTSRQLPWVIWLSREAYAMYFAHYIAIDLFGSVGSDYPWPLPVQILVIFVLSVGIVWSLGKLHQFVMRFNKTVPF